MNEEEDDDNDNDDDNELFDWLATAYQPDLTDYSCTLQDGQIIEISNGETTISL